MSDDLRVGPHFQSFIDSQLASGRYNDVNDVVRDALGLMEERQRRAASVRSSISRGLADADAGRVHDADGVFDEIEARLSKSILANDDR